MLTRTTIEERENLTYSEFETEFRLKNKPVVIRGSVKDWPACSSWNFNYLRHRCGSHVVSGMEYEKNTPVVRRISVSEGVDRIERGEKFYFSEGSIRQEMPELMEDIVVPKVLDDPAVHFQNSSPQGFFGRNTFAPMHFHCGAEAMLTQVMGSKKGLFFKPDSRLSPYFSYSYNFSTIDFRHWHSGGRQTLKNHSALKNSTAYECHLNAGDAIFVPNFWWHSFFGDGSSMSVTFWWNASQPDWNGLYKKIPENVKRCRLRRPVIIALDGVIDLFESILDLRP